MAALVGGGLSAPSSLLSALLAGCAAVSAGGIAPPSFESRCELLRLQCQLALQIHSTSLQVSPSEFASAGTGVVSLASLMQVRV